MNKSIYTILAIFCLSFSLHAQVFVNHAATGMNNGTSWTNAYTDLKTAVANTASGEIWVAQGTYKPTTGADRTISFTLKNNVGIYGGFVGTETAKSQRNFRTNITILSGDINATGNNADNSYHVFFNNGANNTAVLDGFHVVDGRANGTSISTDHAEGAGFFNKSSSPIIRNCTIKNNVAKDNGGGMYNDNNGTNPTVENCIFEGNSTTGIFFPAQGGGGLFNNFGANPKFEGVLFINNNSGLDGGGVFNDFGATLTLINCTIYNNTSGQGGAGIFHRSGATNLLVHNSIVWNNGVSLNAPITLTFSNFPSSQTGTGNISSDPFFIDAANGNFHLQSNSPCTNTGTNAQVTLSQDLDGITRIQETTVDMGVFERVACANIITISTEPVNTTLCENGNGSISMTASGTGLTFQWQEKTGSTWANISNGGVYSGATTASLNFTGLPLSMNGYQYRCALTTSCDFLNSQAVTLTVTSVPTITTQPGNVNTCPAGTAIFSLSVSGGSPSYQWQENAGGGFANISNGGIYSGATTATLTLTAVTTGINMYQYRCLVTTSCNVLTSNAGILSVISDVTVYVNHAATGVNNGSSWTNAFTTVPAAITAADNLSACANAREIWVAQGTYFPTTGTNRSISFNLKNNVEIYGGFLGTETAKSQRNFRTNTTILSGDIGTPGTQSDNTYHVVAAVSSIDGTALLDGFTIEKGKADLDFSNLNGGGFCNLGQPIVNNCTFRNNQANNNGGAVYTSAKLIMTNCIFYNNQTTATPISAEGGGAVFIKSAGTSVLTNCLFYNNSTVKNGGAINVDLAKKLSIFSCTISDNTATGQGSGVNASSFSVFNAHNSIIKNNSFASSFSTITITHSNIQGGHAGTGNIDADPLYVNSAAADYRLQSGSPCVNTGTNAQVNAGEDLDGNGRIQSGTVDMGAYELAGVANPILTYSDVTFQEALANDGGINNSPVHTLTLTGDSFTGTNGENFVASGKLVVTNLSAGLTVVASRSSSTQIDVTITGTATSHANANDVSNLTVTFQNSAFTNGNASNIINSIKSNLALNFYDPLTGGGLSLHLDGAGDYLTTNYAGVTGTGSRTLEAWIKTTINGDGAIASWGANSTGQKWTVRIQPDSDPDIGFLRTEVNGGFIIGTTNLSDDKWHHVAVVLTDDGSPDITEVLLYVDGKLETTSSSGPRAINTATTGTVTIGSDFNNRVFLGQIEELRVWNVARTQTQIRESRHLSLVGNETGLTCYFPFNEIYGNILDLVSSFTGTLVGNALEVNSTCPVASGSCHTLTVTSAGTFNFSNANVTIQFGTTTPNGVVVVNRLNTSPDGSPSGVVSTFPVYWIINNYGTNTTFTELPSIIFSNVGTIDAADAATPSIFQPFKRTFNATGSTWGSFISIGTAAVAGSNGNVTFGSSTGITSFSQFVIGKSSSPLPVELLYFDAVAKGQEVLLEWETGTEINASHFEIEKSPDALRWETIGSVPAANSLTGSQYFFSDNRPFNGANYFRLRQVDFDGSFEFSDIRIVQFKREDLELTVFPNPATDVFFVKNDGEEGLLTLYDRTGKTLLKKRVAEGETLTEISVSHLESGFFVIVLTTREGIQFAKISLE